MKSVRASLAPGTIRGDATRVFALQFVTSGIALVTSVAVARALGPSQKGTVDLFNLLTGFINDLGALGFGTGLLHSLVVRHRRVGAVHGAAIAFAGVVGIATLAAGWLALPLARAVFPGLPNWAMVLAFSGAAVTYYRLIWANLMTGLGRAVTLYWVGLWGSLGTAGVVLALWIGGRLSPASLIVATVLVSTGLCLASFEILRREDGVLRPPPELMRESATYGLVTYASAAANTLHFRIDQVMLNAVLGTSAVGVYAVSVRWAETVFLLDGAVLSAAVRRIGGSEDAESYALTKRLFLAQLAISCAAAAAVAAGAALLVRRVYGSAYSGAAVPMVLLMPGVVAWSAGKVLSQYIVLRRGRSALALLFSATGLLVNVGLNLILIRRVGLNGAATASSLSYGVVIVMTGIAFRALRPETTADALICGPELSAAPAGHR